ncbi:MAG: hypothetical protein Q8K12_00295 [Thiobacillus sp.]|nr:hypothetical protein [Thiobacillus sp.]
MTLGLNACLADEPVGAERADGQVTLGRSWTLKLPTDDRVAFSGALDFEGASVNPGFMMYPAPNPGVFLASVISHALIVGAQKSSQREQAQESADKVLDPYQPILSTVSYQELARRWIDGMLPGSSRKLIGAAESPGRDEWLIETTPVFLMAQDQRTLSLDAVVSIRAPGAPASAGSQSHIRVIAPAEESADLAATWAADQGKKLKEVSAWLFSESLNIAMSAAIDGTGQTGQPVRTIRYLEGTTEKMERAQLISERYGRLLIKTLRGSLMSVPVKVSTATGDNSTAGK